MRTEPVKGNDNEVKSECLWYYKLKTGYLDELARTKSKLTRVLCNLHFVLSLKCVINYVFPRYLSNVAFIHIDETSAWINSIEERNPSFQVQRARVSPSGHQRGPSNGECPRCVTETLVSKYNQDLHKDATIRSNYAVGISPQCHLRRCGISLPSVV